MDGEVRVLDGAPDGSPPPTTLRRLAISGVLARDAGAIGGWRIRLLRAYVLPPE